MARSIIGIGNIGTGIIGFCNRMIEMFSLSHLAGMVQQLLQQNRCRTQRIESRKVV